jgi:heptaprenyl diphosphate synthase
MEDSLARVEEALRSAVRSDDAFLTEVASHLVDAGGKRLRPAMAVAAGSVGSPNGIGNDLVRGGVAVELVHLGSLYHDDVMDEATTRRRVETVNARWGNLTAILAGDFLLARASEIASSLGMEVAGLLAATIGSLCEGQVRELQRVYDTSRSEEAYFLAISGKTAALFSTACRIGALVGGRPAEQVEALTRYGQRFGMAFQIVDDVLDLVATEEDLGKPVGNDLVEGVYTLPVIRALATPVEGPELAAMLGKPLQRAEVEVARGLVRDGSAVDESLEVARGYTEEAVAAIDGLPPGPAVDQLVATARHLLATVPC